MMSRYKALVLEESVEEKFVLKRIFENYDTISVKYVKTPSEFLKYKAKIKYHLFVINMVLESSDMTRIDLVEEIEDSKAWLIMTSYNNCKHFYDGQKALRFNKIFIQKPIDEYIMKTTIDSFLFYQTQNHPPEVQNTSYIMLKQGNFLHKVFFRDVSLIQTNDHATTVFANKKKYIAYISLQKFEILTQGQNFQKVNRNTLVNMSSIQKINLKENYIETEDSKIQISRGCKPLFVSKYANKNTLN
jgi:DNA-binding LytR/AlgR family response regulator